MSNLDFESRSIGPVVTKTEAISNFLNNSTHLDLASMYNYNMEVQVNVAQENGERIEGEFKGKKWVGWRDSFGNTWKPFRIPYNANTKPDYTDGPMNYDLGKYAEGIGMTGWDWVNKVSRWVAYDFDSIVGHSERHAKKLTDIELKDIKERLGAIDWVTIRNSTSGNGLHIYVDLSPTVPTNTHTEHAALARSILGLMSAKIGKNLEAAVDACGQNMWVWHRKMLGTNGLRLLKSGVPLTTPPMNWKDHVAVVAGQRKRVVPKFAEQDVVEKLFSELSGQRTRVELDDDHRRLITYLEGLKFSSWYDADNNMLVTHAYALKEAHRELGLRGVYETASSGSEVEQNCFCYPMRNGAWVVRRFTRGVGEHCTWSQDRNGWTCTYLNKDPDLKVLAALYSGVEHPQGGYVFNEAEMAVKVAADLGSNIEIPPYVSNRPTRLKYTKEGKISIEFEHDSRDQPLKGWILERKKWKRVLDIRESDNNEVNIGNYDDIVRHLVDESGSDLGWVIKTDGTWRTEPISHVKMFLEGYGLDREQIKKVFGSSVIRCWTIVNKPFDVEYPGERQWNRHAPQFRYPPSTDLDNLHYPTWLKILNHCGNHLDDYIAKDDWCKMNGVLTGADYLKCWIASVFQKPAEPLPYLFFYSPEQNTGKSIFHEALSLLVTSGVVRADQALGDTQFNGELENAVICVIEETDISNNKNKTAYNRIKDWVTSRQLPIRRLYETARLVVNTTHWIQCSNDRNSVPIFPGDTRIVMIYVKPLDTSEIVAKRDLITKLIKEAPDFLASIVSLELPECNDRLNIPVIMTADKADSEQSNKSPLELFIEEKTYYAPGKAIPLAELYTEFENWADSSYLHYWTKIRFGKEINKNKYPKGRMRNNPNWHIGNISLIASDLEECKDKKKYVLSSDSFLDIEGANL